MAHERLQLPDSDQAADTSFNSVPYPIAYEAILTGEGCYQPQAAVLAIKNFI
jgi:hypothetical protein